VVLRFVIERQEPIRSERHRGVCPALVVTEFDFVDPGRQTVYYRSNLTALEPLFGKFLHERDDRKHLELGHGVSIRSYIRSNVVK